MKKHLRVLGVLVCLLPLMTGCLPQTKVKQESSSSHKTSQTTKKKTSSSSSSESQVSETSSSRAAASHAPVTKGVAGEQPATASSQAPAADQFCCWTDYNRWNGFLLSFSSPSRNM